jgi:UrcA family protein
MMKELVMRVRSLRAVLFGAAVSVAGVGIVAGAPASAQTTVEEFIVTGHNGPDNEATSLSQAVSYADLDLSSAEGRYELRHRVSVTARYLCRRLGEDDTSDGVVPSCRDAAVRDAMTRARPIIVASERDAEWAAASAWRPPYRSSWDDTYPDSPYP